MLEEILSITSLAAGLSSIVSALAAIYVKKRYKSHESIEQQEVEVHVSQLRAQLDSFEHLENSLSESETQKREHLASVLSSIQVEVDALKRQTTEASK